MSTMIPNPQTNIPGGAGYISAPPTDDPNLQVDPVQSFSLPANYMLPNSIDNQLQQGAPLGAFTDSQYLADEAGLRNQIAQQYSDLLQQLGYQDPSSGRIIPGRMIQDANIQMSQYQQAMQDAARQVTQNAQQAGTIFSGIRGQQLEQAQRPTVQGQAGLILNTNRNLADVYANAQKLASNYNTQNNQFLAAAAARQAAALMAAPPVINVYGGGTSSLGVPVGAPPVDTTPPADTSTPDVQYSGPAFTNEQPAAVGSADSPYYYGGGGYAPSAPSAPISPPLSQNNVNYRPPSGYSSKSTATQLH